MADALDRNGVTLSATYTPMAPMAIPPATRLFSRRARVFTAAQTRVGDSLTWLKDVLRDFGVGISGKMNNRIPLSLYLEIK